MQTFCLRVCVCWEGCVCVWACCIQVAQDLVCASALPPHPRCGGNNVWFQHPISSHTHPPPHPLYLYYSFDRIHPPSLQVWWGWRGGRERKKVRQLNGVSGKTFPLHLFPCTVEDLWSCLKAYFLYRFVWLDNRLWTSLSALQQIRVQESLFFFYWKISILSDLSFSFKTLQCRSLNQMAGKQLLFHKGNLSTFWQSWYPRNVHSTAHRLDLCFDF